MINKQFAPRGGYIPARLEAHCLNGDTFIKIEDAYRICTEGRYSYQTFEQDLTEQLKRGTVCREGTRLYLAKTLRYEDSAAKYLAAVLQDNSVFCHMKKETLDADGLALNEEQRSAILMGLSHRLSIVLGGAGTGKSTLVSKLIDAYPKAGIVLCAPTGKAARNLTERTGHQCRTVHSALGLRPNDDALSPVVWEHVGLVVVDEASMLTIELLAGLLCKTRRDCRIVLIGDPNQLLSVGSGNVLPDLLTLGIPHVELQQNYRQKDQDTALFRNVLRFTEIRTDADLAFDHSFRFEELGEPAAEKALVEEAVSRYRAGESIQVLAPYNARTRLSVRTLNYALQTRLNPAEPNKKELCSSHMAFRDGDRVIITKNDHERACANGDVGTLHIEDDNTDAPVYYVDLPDGRRPKWVGWDGIAWMSLAYALTVHKSQGSQYDVILFPMVNHFSGMLYRNLLYTAISRAKKQVILYGSRNALAVAVQTDAQPRRSMLVAKTRMARLRSAA